MGEATVIETGHFHTAVLIVFTYYARCYLIHLLCCSVGLVTTRALPARGYGETPSGYGPGMMQGEYIASCDVSCDVCSETVGEMV